MVLINTGVVMATAAQTQNKHTGIYHTDNVCTITNKQRTLPDRPDPGAANALRHFGLCVP